MIAADNRFLKSVLQFVVRPVPASILTALFNFLTCYFRSFVSGKVPVVLWGDQIGFFTDGSRMALGQLPYRDYFKIVPPGTDLTYALLIKVFGVQMWIPNLLMAFLAALTALLMTLIASRLMRGAIIVLPGLLLASFILLASTDATHHWFSTIAILGALLVIMDGITLPRIAIAGALSGVAACFTQSKGAMAVAAFVVYLAAYANRQDEVPSQRRMAEEPASLRSSGGSVRGSEFVLHSGGRLTNVALLPDRVSAPVLSFTNDQQLASADRRLSIPCRPHHVGGLFLCVCHRPMGLLRVFCWLRGNYGRRMEGDRRDKLLLVAMTGSAMFLAVASAPSLKRLATVSPPAMIVLVWLLNQPGKAVAGLKVLLRAQPSPLRSLYPSIFRCDRPPT